MWVLFPFPSLPVVLLYDLASVVPPLAVRRLVKLGTALGRFQRVLACDERNVPLLAAYTISWTRINPFQS